MNEEELESYRQVANRLDAIASDTRYPTTIRQASGMMLDLVEKAKQLQAQLDAVPCVAIEEYYNGTKPENKYLLEIEKKIGEWIKTLPDSLWE